jgi:RNA polymerase sigma factor (sigma-70 family)
VAGDAWFTTKSSIRRGEAGWEVIVPYADPIARFLSLKFPTLSQADRDDLTQDLLIAMKTQLVEKYDAAKGGFRPYLRTAIVNRVRDMFRRKAVRKAGEIDDDAVPAAEVTEGELLAIDVEACLIGALQAFHDRVVQVGDPDGLEVLYAFSGCLIDGLSNDEIAKRESKSRDQVKRLLQRARAEVLEGFLKRAVPELEGSGLLPSCADLVRRALREPRRRARVIEAEKDRRLAAFADRFLDQLATARDHLPRLGTEAGADFERGLRAVFSDEGS